MATDVKYSCLKSVLENEPTSPDIRVKRKFRTSLTVKNKLEVIEYATMHPSATQSKIAQHFGIDRTTVSKVLKRRADILSYADQFNGSNELMYTSLMKKEKGSSPNSTTSENGVAFNNNQSGKKFNVDGTTVGNNNNKLRPLLPKAGSGDISPSEKVVDLSSKSKIPKKPARNNSKSNKESQPDVYHPELTSKCESWFMDQNLSPSREKNNAEHVNSIRSFSKLLSMIPLSDCECYKILAGKYVRDACLVFARTVAGELSESCTRAISTRSYELLHRFLLEGMPYLDLSQFYCNGFTAFEADDVKRIWVKYVQPKLTQIVNDERERQKVTHAAGYDLQPVIFGNEDQLNSVMEKDNEMMSYPEYESCSSYPESPVSEDVVRGSRKRKMNSRPIRMVASDSENINISANNGEYTNEQPLNFSGSNSNKNVNGSNKAIILGTISQNNNKTASNILAEVLNTAKKRRIKNDEEIELDNKTEGKVISAPKKNEYPVIEIKPDGCSDDEVTSKNHDVENSSTELITANNNIALVANSQPILNTANQLLLTYTKNLEARIAKLENKPTDINKSQLQEPRSCSNEEILVDQLSQSCIDSIVDKCNKSVKNIISALSDQVAEVVQDTSSNNNKDKEEEFSKECGHCSHLKNKVEVLENKIDKIQGILDKFIDSPEGVNRDILSKE